MRILIPALLIAAPAFAQDWNIYDGDVALSPEEIQSQVEGQTLVFYDNGRSVFGADGGYSYTYDGGGTAVGTYTVEGDGVICIDFENGWSRCDKYVRSGARMILLTAKGERYPIRPKDG